MKYRNSPLDWMLLSMVATLLQIAAPSTLAGDCEGIGMKFEGDTVERVPKTGVRISRGPGGWIRSRDSIVDGELEGICEQWWEDGIPSSRMKFHRGVLVDSFYSWHMDGSISEIGVYEDGNPISTENWDGDGTKRYRSVQLRDSTYHTMRWNESGEKTKDTLEIHPKVRRKFRAPLFRKMICQ